MPKKTFKNIAAMRGNLGVDDNERNRRLDAKIEAMTPMERLRLICGWHLGDRQWADTVLGWAEDAGMKIDYQPKETSRG